LPFILVLSFFVFSKKNIVNKDHEKYSNERLHGIATIKGHVSIANKA
jgi:hypothetical protein